jgi:NAD(P)-dependent dehydrogenase (short-subunit alcohol dehydrogenase family)
MLLKDKVVLVTGATTGIGEAIARRCVSEGAKVMLHGRNEERAKAICRELKEASDYVMLDIADPEHCDALVKKTVARFGAIHGVVNNAALTTRSTIDSTDAAFFDHLIAINLRAPLLITRAAVQNFRQQGTGGVVLNIGSINAYCGQPDLLVYSISKGGLATMTRNLADALGIEKIRINQLNVGWTTTDNEIRLKVTEGLPEDWYNHVPLVFAPSGKLLTPQDIARHALFWISDESAPVSGSVCDVEQYPVIGRNKIAEWKSQ